MACFLPFALSVASRSEVFQLRFAREAAERLVFGDALNWKCTAKGLELLGESEDVLSDAVAHLRAVYADDLAVGEVRVRYRWETMPLEPVMMVDVTVPSVFGQRTLNIIRARDVVLESTEKDQTAWRLLGQGHASRVLGLRSQLDVLTNSTAATRVTLFGYFFPPSGPGGSAA